MNSSSSKRNIYNVEKPDTPNKPSQAQVKNSRKTNPRFSMKPKITKKNTPKSIGEVSSSDLFDPLNSSRVRSMQKKKRGTSKKPIKRGTMKHKPEKPEKNKIPGSNGDESIRDLFDPFNSSRLRSMEEKEKQRKVSERLRQFKPQPSLSSTLKLQSLVHNTRKNRKHSK